ncbi:MAG: ABC transporter permease [Pseudomonadota bacterium]
MSPLAAIAAALLALRVNALRSVLAMLGVIIGVTAVITTVAMAQGARQAVEDQISSLGANSLMMRPGSANRGGRRGGGGSATWFSDADAEALRTETASIAAAAGVIQTNNVTAVSEFENWTTTTQGAHPDFFEVRDWPIAEGRFYTGAENERGARVVVLGRTTANELFPDGGAIGSTIRMNRVPLEVVGILSVRGQSSRGQDQDDVVFTPTTTLRDRLVNWRFPGVRDPVFMIWLEVAPGVDMDVATEEINDLMRERRGIRPGQQDDFAVLNFAEFIQARNETERILGVMLAVVGAVTLIVGGIGIMNIMLVSVTERTREIGLRLAVGARRRDIRNQFLVEALVLCFAGGLMGLALGVAAAFGVGNVLDTQVGVDGSAALVAILASAAVGVGFGFYPALRASRLDPIEALRHE